MNILHNIILEAISQDDLELMRSTLLSSGMSEEDVNAQLASLSPEISPVTEPIEPEEKETKEEPEVVHETDEIIDSLSELGDEEEIEPTNEKRNGKSVLNNLKQNFTKKLKSYKTVYGTVEDYTDPRSVFNKSEAGFEVYITFISGEIERFRDSAQKELKKLPESKCGYAPAALLRNTPLSDFISGDELREQIKISLIRGYFYYTIALSVYYDLSPRNNDSIFYQPSYKSAIGARLKSLGNLATIDREGKFNVWYKKTCLDHVLPQFKMIFPNGIKYLFARNDYLSKWLKLIAPNLVEAHTEIKDILFEIAPQKPLRPLKDFDRLTKWKEKKVQEDPWVIKNRETSSGETSTKTNSLSDALFDILLERFIPVLVYSFVNLTKENFKEQVDTIDQEIFKNFSSPDNNISMAINRVNKVNHSLEGEGSANITELESGEANPEDVAALTKTAMEVASSRTATETHEKGLADLIQDIGGNDLFDHINNGNVLILISDMVEKYWKKNKTFSIPIVVNNEFIEKELFSWLETQHISDPDMDLNTLKTIFGADSLTTSQIKFMEYFIPILKEDTNVESIEEVVESFNKFLNGYKNPGFVPTNLSGELSNALIQQFGLSFEKVAVNKGTILNIPKEQEEAKTFKELITDNLKTRNIAETSEEYIDLMSAKTNSAFYLIACSIFSAKVINNDILPVSKDKDSYLRAAREVYPFIEHLIKDRLFKNKIFGTGSAYKGLNFNELLVFFALASSEDIKAMGLEYATRGGSNQGGIVKNNIEKIITLRESKENSNKEVIQQTIKDRVYKAIADTIIKPEFSKKMKDDFYNFSKFIFAFSFNPVDFYTPAELKGTSKDFKGGDLKGILLDGALSPRQRRFIVPKLFSFLENPVETSSEAQKFFVDKFSFFKAWLIEKLNERYEDTRTKEEKLALRPMLLGFHEAIKSLEEDDNILPLKTALETYKYELFKDRVSNQYLSSFPIRFHNVFEGILNGRLTSLRQSPVKEEPQEEPKAELTPIKINKKFTL